MSRKILRTVFKLGKYNLIVIEVLETTSSTIIGEVHLQKMQAFQVCRISESY